MKGSPLPEGAFHGGSLAADGVLYVGRLGANAEVGKINTVNGTIGSPMCHLWCHSTGKSLNGEILCFRPKKIEIMAKLVPVLEVNGGGSGTTTCRHKVRSGWRGQQYNSESHTTVFSQVSASIDGAKFSASASIDSDVKSAFSSVLSSSYQEEEVEKTFEVDLRKPMFVYQAEIELPGYETSIRGDVLVFSSESLGSMKFMV